MSDATMALAGDSYTSGMYSMLKSTRTEFTSEQDISNEIKSSSKDLERESNLGITSTKSGKVVTFSELLRYCITSDIPDDDYFMTKENIGKIIDQSMRIGAIGVYLESIEENVGVLNDMLRQQMATLKSIQAKL